MSPSKVRLDLLVLERGFAESREGARRLIQSGLIKVNGVVRDKSGESVPEDASVESSGPALRYVSRGGLKMEKAIREFSLDLKGKVAMDIGASTGGFTDCMLQNGAAKVYCVDVGYGQLAWKLRSDPRVVVMERTNARYLDPGKFEPGIAFVAMDVSFISCLKVLPSAIEACSEALTCVVLVKPQFEAGREKVGKNGVVRDAGVHRQVLTDVAEGAVALGLKVEGITFSPVKGPEGNIEYLMLLKRGGPETAALQDLGAAIEAVVGASHKAL